MVFDKNVTRPSFINTCNSITVKFADQPIEHIVTTTFLEILIDNQLTWKPHIANLLSSLATTVGVLFKIRLKINNKTAMLIYDSLIASKLAYCNILWGSTYASSLSPLLMYKSAH